MKVNIVIMKGRGIENASFGTARSQIRATFGIAPKSIKSQAWDRVESDYYDNTGLRFSYDENLRLCNIGILPLANVFYKGLKLETQDVKKILKQLRNLGYKPENTDQGYYFDKLGLCISCEGRSVSALELYMGRYEDLLQESIERASAYYKS